MTTPTLHTRRHFLRTSLMGGALAATLPGFIYKTFGALESAAAGAVTQVTTGKDGTILVIVQLAGGNDGLNTLIPFGDDNYYQLRPKLALAGDRILPVSNGLGLNARLENLRAALDSGEASIIQGVGYPNPNRSHFRSMEIWHTGSDSNSSENTGWLGRYFDNCCSGEDAATVGVSIGERAPQAFSSKEPKGIAIRNPATVKDRSAPKEDSAMMMSDDHDGDAGAAENSGASIGMIDGRTSGGTSSLDFIQRVNLDAQIATEKIAAATARYHGGIEYPPSGLGRDLKFIAQMIAGALPSRVYYAGMGGFDTHANQVGTHEKLLGDFDRAMAAFVSDLKEQGNFDRVTIMTFSEFGRRVKENSGGGTDHGTAAPMFLMGGGIRPGILGTAPSLTDLDSGDLKFTTDFRRVYAGLLDNWLGVPHAKVLGRKFDAMELFQA